LAVMQPPDAQPHPERQKQAERPSPEPAASPLRPAYQS
jgi:hypothetical protein